MTTMPLKKSTGLKSSMSVWINKAKPNPPIQVDLSHTHHLSYPGHGAKKKRSSNSFEIGTPLRTGDGVEASPLK